MDNPQRLLRVAQPTEQPAHPDQPELGGDIRHAEPLVVEPAIQEVEALVIGVEHGRESIGPGFG